MKILKAIIDFFDTETYCQSDYYIDLPESKKQEIHEKVMSGITECEDFIMI